MTRVSRDARMYLRGTTIDYDVTTHNAHLIRARLMQKRVVTLLVEWSRTGEERFRLAVLAHVRQMGRWKYWSWIRWREGNAKPEAIFDLSYGENATTLAIAWDWLYPTLAPGDKAEMLRIARRWPFAAFSAQDKAGGNWWYGRADCNWNTVCAGGLGMLVLAMMGDAPEAEGLLARAEDSMRPYFEYMDRLDGGWPEGIGYWGYGMRYAFLYLLSWEQAHGRPHPMMQRRGVRRTLDFPLDFSPNGVPCSFSDVNRYNLHPFHYALAERCGRYDVVKRLDRLAGMAQPRRGVGQGIWPTDVELILFHPRMRYPRVRVRRNVVCRYPVLDWYWLADRWPDPDLYLSIRGGTTEVPHNHLDLMSFHCVVRDESMLTSLGPSEYLDTTFSPRRWELHEMVSASKNTMLINGVGITRPAKVASRVIRVGGYPAVRLDATEAMGRIKDGQATRFCGRLFVWLNGKGILLIDRAVMKHFGRVESRFHTLGAVVTGRSSARIRGKRQRLAMGFAADVPCAVRLAADAMTSPGPDPRMIRWCTDGLHHQVTLATLLVPGGKGGLVGVRAARGRVEVLVKVPGLRKKIVLTDRLQPVRRSGLREGRLPGIRPAVMAR